MASSAVAFLRALMRRAAAACGFDVVRVPVGIGPYVRNYPYPFATYAPWFEPAFLDRYAAIRGRTLVTEDRCYVLATLSRYAATLGADFAECGVYRGGTAFLLASALREAGHDDTPFHLFDTFRGIPNTAVPERDWHRPGDLADTSEDTVRQFLASFPNIVLHPGLIPSTFDTVKGRRFALVHLDVDLYPSTWDTCAFFYERLVPGAILICDDYGFPDFRRAAKQAIDDYFASKPEAPLALHTGQCLVIKC